MNRRNQCLVCLVSALCIPAVLAYAGPLDPPAGPVQETGTRMVFLPTGGAYSISQPGSYKLTRNAIYAGLSRSIQITASGVTLDLGGFVLEQVPVVVADGIRDVVIKNGRINCQWVLPFGIRGPNAVECRIEGVSVFEFNYGAVDERVGILLGDRCEVRGCVVSGSDGLGIKLGHDSHVADCVVNYHSSGGVVVGNRSTVRNVSCRYPAYPGGTGISAGSASLVESCSIGEMASLGGRTAIAVGDASVVRFCTVNEPPYSNGNKIVAAANCLITGCSLGNTSIVAGAGSRVESCTIRFTQPQHALIEVADRCTVARCTLSGGLEGIKATGPGTHIDENTIGGAATAISLIGTGSRVTRNSISGAAIPISNPAGVPGNDVGPIGTAATATSPWANHVN